MNDGCCTPGRPLVAGECCMGQTDGPTDCERESDCNESWCKEDTSLGKIRDVKINQVNYGYIVNIGCHTFAFETAERLIEKLGIYLKEPNKTERSWYQGTLL
jgi:hypothetical protein